MILQQASAKTVFFSVARWLIGTVCGLLLVASLACLWLLGTAHGRVTAANWGIDAANQTGLISLQVRDLQSPELGIWHAEQIILTLPEQATITLQSLNLEFNPRALLAQRVEVYTLDIASAQVELLAKPARNDEEQPAIVLPNLADYSLPEISLAQYSVGELSIGDIQLGNDTNLPPVSLNGRVSMASDQAATADLAIATRRESPALAPATSTVDISVRHIDNQWHLAALVSEPAPGLLAKLTQAKQPFPITADLKLSATSTEEQLTVAIDHFNTQWSQIDITATGAMKVSPQLDFGRVDLRIDSQDQSGNSTTQTTAQTQQVISANWAEQSQQLELTLNNLPTQLAAPWVPDLPASHVSGQLIGSADLSAALPNFAVNWQINLTNTQLSTPITTTGTVEGDRHNVAIEQINAAWQDGRLDIAGNIAVAEQMADLSAQLSEFNTGILANFGIQLPADLAATISQANLTAQGKFSQLNVNTTVNALGRLRTQPWALELAANTSLNATAPSDLINSMGTIAITSAQVSLTQSQPEEVYTNHLEAEGVVNLSAQTLQLDTRVKQFPLDVLKAFDLAIPEPISAKLDGDISVRGVFTQPEAQADLTLAGYYADIPLQLAAQASWQNQQLAVTELNLATFGQATLDAKGQVTAETIDFTVTTDRLPSQLLESFGMRLPRAELTADLTLQGPLTSPMASANAHYQTRVSGFDQNGERAQIPLAWQLKLETSDTLYQAHSQFTRMNENIGSITVTAPRLNFANNSSNPLENSTITTAGELDLRALALVLNPDHHRLAGKLSVNAELNNSDQGITGKGVLNIIDGQYRNPIAGTGFKNINCKVTATDQVVTLDSCNASDGQNGRVSLQGTADLAATDSSSTIDITVKAKNANIIRRSDIENETTGTIELTGNRNQLKATGQLEVTPLRATIGNSYSGIEKINVTRVYSLDEQSVNEPAKDSNAPEIELDIAITATNQAYIRGQGLDAELSGQIKLTGSAYAPSYSGEFSTLKGTLQLLGKRFELTRGQVYFSNNALAIDVSATLQRQGRTITANLSGTENNLSLALSSEPSMPEDEIIAFIIFGKSAKSITPVEALQLAAAVQSLRSGSSGFDPLAAARDSLGADTLTVESETNSTGQNNYNLTLGKYLTDDVYLIMQRTTNPTQPWRASIRIELTPNLYLESSSGGQTDREGAELHWSRDY